MRDKIIGFIISVVCFIISFGFVKGQAMALPFVPTDWTWEMYQGLHMLGDLIANDVNFDIPDWVDFNDFDDVKAFLEMIYNEGKQKVAYASIIADMCVGTWHNFLVTGEVSLPFSESTVKRTHNTGFFQHVVDTINSVIPEPDVNYLSYINKMNTNIGRDSFYWGNRSNISDLGGGYNMEALTYPFNAYSYFPETSFSDLSLAAISTGSYQRVFVTNILDLNIVSNGDTYSFSLSFSRISPCGRQAWGSYSPLYSFEFFYEDYGTYVFNGSTTSNSNPVNFTCSYSGSLSEVLSFASDRFRNVNIYVDGNPWALVGGTAIDNPLGVVIPQNVIDEVENGKISGLVIDATLPDTDNLVGSIDLGVVMDELREAQANGRTATLDGVRTKDGVRALDGTVVGTLSKAVAIDVPSTASLVTAADDWGYIPYYPEIPSAFSGTTILSELIDATQTIIPNDLIMAIWGLVIILFIIALINIFHK